MIRRFIVVAAILFGSSNLFAQTAPVISYITPQVFATGTTITPLTPTNTGGTVPATVYGTVTTFAGTAGSSGSTNATGTAAKFNNPEATALDASGNLYVVDAGNNCIRRVTPAGVVTTFVGNPAVAAALTNGVGTAALFNQPNGILIDATSTNMYVSEFGNNSIRKVVISTATVTTLTASLTQPAGMAFDAAGTNIYVTQQGGNNLKTVSVSTGVITHYSGSTTGIANSTNGNATNSRYNNPVDVALSGTFLYVVDNNNNMIRRLTASTGTSTTFAGATTPGYVNATTTTARFKSPYGLALDGAGNLYIGDANNHNIRKITSAGAVSLLVGDNSTIPVSGTTDGILSAARFNNPRDITISTDGTMYVADYSNHTIRKVNISGYTISPTLPTGLSFDSATGTISGTPTTVTAATSYTITAYNYYGSASTTISITTIAPPSLSAYGGSPYLYPINKAITSLTPVNTGGAIPATVYGTVSLFAGSATGVTGTGTGTGTAARFNNPADVTVFDNGSMYVADRGNHAIRMLSTTAAETTYAGTSGTSGRSNTGVGTFNSPSGIAADVLGNLTIADRGNHEVRKITATPMAVSLFAGNASGTSGSVDATGSAASFNAPTGIVRDASGNLYVADQTNHKIRKITAAGVVTTFAGTGSTGAVDANGTLASFSSPADVVLDASGNLYVADKGNRKIRKITPAGDVTTFAGSGTAGSTDGVGIAATFNAPNGIAIDRTGNLYVSDGGTVTSHKIRMINPAGIVSTVAGTGAVGLANGVGTVSTFSTPAGLSVDPTTGNIFVADGGNNQIRRIIGTGYSITPTLPTGLSFSNSTGIISGTPTVVTAATTYTITGFNIAGSSSVQISIETEYAEPSISYTTPVSYLAGTALGTGVNSPAPTPSVPGSPVITTLGYSSTPTQPLSGATFTGPARIGVDASGNVYVANFGGTTVSKFDANGNLLTASYGTGAPAAFVSPAGIVFDSNGNCYILNTPITSAAYIYKFNSLGAYQSTIALTGTAVAYGLAIDASDNLYITNYPASGTTYAIYKYTTSTSTLNTTFISGATNLTQPIDIDIDAAGNIYVLNYANGTASAGYVSRFTSAGGFTSKNVFTGYSAPYGLKIDPVNGYMYIADYNAHNLRVYVGASNAFPNTTGALSISMGGSSDCRGLAVDRRGGVYASDYNTNKVYRYLPTGLYFINKYLPGALSIGKTTGAIGGTPTAATSSVATDYTITAWNGGGGSSTVLNMTIYQNKTWVSTSNTSWSTAANWTGGVPGPADKAVIGTSGTLATPTITTAGKTYVGSISFVNSGTNAPSISVASGDTLVLTGDITYTNTKASNLTANISGAGSIKATNLKITNSFSAAAYAINLNSSISDLELSGDLILTSITPTGTNYDDADFTLSGTGKLTAKNIQTVNANAGNNPTIAIGNNTTLNLTGASPLSGLSSTGINTITIGTGTTFGYTGNNDQEIYTDLAIPNSSLTSGISYANLAVGGSGIKTPQGDANHNLNVSGNFTNSLVSNSTDTYLDLSNTNLNFTGSTQAITAGDGLGTTLYNTTFSGGGTKTMSGTGTGVFTVASVGTLSLSGSSTLASGGVLTLTSDATSSATIPTIPSGSKITGNVVAQRFVTGGGNLLYRGYRLFSSPVSDINSAGAAPYPYYNLSYITNAAGSGTYTTGASGGGFDAAGNPTMYLYREDVAPSGASFTSGNYRAITKINNASAYSLGVIDGPAFSMPAGTGFLFFYRGNATTNPGNAPADNILKPSGYLNQGQITVKNWVTNTDGLLYNSATLGDVRYDIQGFNLVGNPYPSSIDWNKSFSGTLSSGIYAPNTDKTVYILNVTTKNYDAYITTSASTGVGQNGMSSIIPQGQGFFVRATGSGAQLVFNEDAKVTDQPDILLLNTAIDRKQSRLKLQLLKDTINKDETVVQFDNETHTAYVRNEDALYLKGTGVVSLSNRASNNVALAISQMPFPQKSQIIPLNVGVNAAGIYKLKLNEKANIPDMYDIWLMDKFKNDSLDLKHNNTYNFNTTSDTATYGANRFKLVIRLNADHTTRLLNFTGTKDNKQVKLQWTSENEGEHTIYVLQRSTNGGISYSTLDSLTSLNLGTYDDIDPNPVTGENKYRVKQIDVLGNVTYSAVLSFTFALPVTAPTGTVLAYPNPVKHMLAIVIKPINNKTGTYNVTITNNMGIVVKKVNINRQLLLQDVSNMLPGTYIITVVNNTNNTLAGQTSFIKL
ncbi:MAG: putative Ig domain-containing protein [Bacteroidota bacterium]